MNFPAIISPIRRHGYGSLVVLLLTSLTACGGDGPTTPPPTPQAPTVACPANIESTVIGGQSTPVSFTTPVASGGTAPVAVTCSPASGTAFATGTTAVTCTATDGAGRSSACGFTVTVRAVPTISRTKFMTFGDSVTAGQLGQFGPTWGLPLVTSPPHSYPAKLLGLLTARYSSQQLVIANEGLDGERVVDSLSRFSSALSRNQPEAVLLMHGINDLNGTAAGKTQAAVDAMEELIKEAGRRGIPIFVGTLPPLGPGGKAGCPECVGPYNERLTAVALAKGGILVDVHGAWGNRSGLMGSDGIHPTEAGYEAIATAFFDAIRRTLETASLQ